MISAGRGLSINMDWFRKLMKEGNLKAFTVRYDGIIEEKEYKDFDFLSVVSQTCPLAAKTDEMTLNRNKIKIFSNILKYYGFSQEEIDKFENNYEKYREINKINSESRNYTLKQKLHISSILRKRKR